MRKTRSSLLAALMLLAASCGRQQENHLSPRKMQEVLLDINLAEGYSMTLHPDSTKRNVERNLDSLAVFYKSVLKHHGISQQDFEQSLDWYKHHPEELDSIYAAIIPEMSKLEATYN